MNIILFSIQVLPMIWKGDYEHKHQLIKGFTQKYNVNKLVYFEQFDYIDFAIAREKQIKGYSRAKKFALINQMNKEWTELTVGGKSKTPCATGD